MKLSKVLKCLVLGFVMVGFITSYANAAWYTCKIDKVGGTQTSTRVQLTDLGSPRAFYMRWFDISPGKENQLLATALTAFSSSSKVSVQLLSVVEFQPLYGLYIMP